MKKMISLLLSAMMLLAAYSSAYAEEVVRIDYEAVPLTDTWVDGKMEDNE